MSGFIKSSVALEQGTLRGDACTTPVSTPWIAPNRLVAAELGKMAGITRCRHKSSWEKKELAVLKREQPGPLSTMTKEELLALAEDLTQLWRFTPTVRQHSKSVSCAPC